MKELTITPYHPFVHKGVPFVFDIANGVFFRTTRSAQRLFESGESVHPSREGRCGRRDAADLTLLRQRGYFPRTARTFTEAENDRYIEQLLATATNKIELFLAESCNLACKYCYCRRNQTLNKGLMPEEVALRAVEFVMERGGGKKFPWYEITFFGGEPLLNKLVMKKVIDYLEDRVGGSAKLHFSLTTNGTLLDDEVISHIKKYNFGLMISVDGPPHVHDAMRPFRNGKGSFERTARNLKRLMSVRKQVTARVTLTKNFLDVAEIVRFLEDFGFTRIGLSASRGTSFARGRYDLDHHDFESMEKQFEFLLEHFFERLRSNEPTPYNPVTGAIDSFREQRLVRMRCGVGRGTTSVGIDGKLYPCHRYVGMENYVLGDIWDGINKDRYRAYLKGYFATKEKCQNCWAIHFCGGECPWYLSHPDGYFMPPSDKHCDSIRKGLERAAWLVDKVAREFPDYYARLVGLTQEAESEFFPPPPQPATGKVPAESEEPKACI